MNFSVRVEKVQTADVVVVGGGTAGVFAAIAAARSGADVLLIEKNSMLGGTVTTACVDFPGLFFAWGKQIIDGPCWEAIRRCDALGGAVMPKITFKPERHWHEQIRLNRFVFTHVLWEMCREAGVRVLTNAMVSAGEETADGLQLLFTDKEGLFAVQTKYAIDCTGDGSLAALLGYARVKSPTQQPATPQNRIGGYDPAGITPEMIEERRNACPGLVPEYVSNASLMNYLRIHKIDIHIPCKDAETSLGRTELERDTAAVMMQTVQFYRGIPGLENLQVEFIAEETGVRETCRIVGEKVITQEEYIQAVLYPDSVCYTFYPIDLHVMHGIEKHYLPENTVAKIPYGALVPKGSKRLLCAGRCVSSDTYANSAVRVQAPCMAMGQAAGCAAALCAKIGGGVYDLPYEELKAALQKLGAIVPEK